jgi:hypothetical protein
VTEVSERSTTGVRVPTKSGILSEVTPSAPAQAVARCGSACKLLIMVFASQLFWLPESPNRPGVSLGNWPPAVTGVATVWSWPTGSMNGFSPGDEVGSSWTWAAATVGVVETLFWVETGPAISAPTPTSTAKAASSTTIVVRTEIPGPPAGRRGSGGGFMSVVIRGVLLGDCGPQL